MLRTTAFVLTAVFLAACTSSDPPTTQEPTPPPTQIPPTTGGFLPLQPTEIHTPTTGTWICTPASPGHVSRCVSRGSTHRPGIVPGVNPPLDAVIEPVVEGPTAAEAMAIVRTRKPLPMHTP